MYVYEHTTCVSYVVCVSWSHWLPIENYKHTWRVECNLCSWGDWHIQVYGYTCVSGVHTCIHLLFQIWIWYLAFETGEIPGALTDGWHYPWQSVHVHENYRRYNMSISSRNSITRSYKVILTFRNSAWCTEFLWAYTYSWRFCWPFRSARRISPVSEKAGGGEEVMDACMCIMVANVRMSMYSMYVLAWILIRTYS